MRATIQTPVHKKPVYTVDDMIDRSKPCQTFMTGSKVSDIVRKMYSDHTGAAGITDTAGRFIGMVTEQEILRRLFHPDPERLGFTESADPGRSYEDLTAWDVMIANPATLPSGTPVEEALETISAHDFRYMPVVARHDPAQLYGIVSERELFLHTQEKYRRELDSKDTLLCYFMHHEPYGCGASMR